MGPDQDQPIRRRIRFEGRVQGVGFRATTRDIARRHRLSGWVRNESDGSVLMEAQGNAQALEAALAEVARVMERHIVHRHAAPIQPNPTPGETAFEIRH